MRSSVLPRLLAVAMALSACSNLPGQPPRSGPQTTPVPPAVAVSVAPATQTTITQTLSGAGNVVADYEVDVVPKQSGRIDQLKVSVGTQVKAGDVIAQLDHTNQDLSLESARAGLEAAQAKLATIEAGPRPETVREAELAVSTAQSKLQAMINGARPASVDSARAAVDAAQQKLAAILAGPRPESVASAQAGVTAAQAKLAAMQAQGLPNAVAQAQAGVTAAQAKLQALKNGPRPVDIAPVQIAVSQAKDSLYSQQVTRDATCRFPSPACTAADAAVDAAWNGVNLANANLRKTVAPPAQTDLQQARAAVDQAQAVLGAAKTPYTPQDIQQGVAAVRQAQASLGLAAQPYTPQDVQQARDAVTQAQASLTLTAQPYTAQDLEQAQYAVENAIQQLALAQQPYTAQDRQAAQAAVDQAQAGVDQALQAVKDTTVTAPIGGVISAVDLNAGDVASTSTTIVTIASNAVKVEVPVQEAQVADLKVGDNAAITGVVLGNKSIPGKVTNIAPSGNTQSRSFTVDVTPDQQGQLKPGMFVQVAIAIQVHANATVVPSTAIVQKESGSFVFVVQNNVAHQVAVKTGLTSNDQTEIVSGIRPGQQVVIEGEQDLSDGERVRIVPGTPGAQSTPTA